MNHNDFHAFQHRTKRPHYCDEDENKFYCAKRKYDERTDGIRKDVFYNKKELAVFKNVVIRCRTSGYSFNKIARAFRISSRTVYEWVKQTGHFVNPLKNMDWYVFKTKPLHVNIKDIAKALLSNILAYRNGWIAEINIDNILNGETIH